MSREIVDYPLVSCCEVATALKDGWQPFGSPFHSTQHSKLYKQAMVKYEKKMHFSRDYEVTQA